jgi:hypothetical protein
MVVTFVRLPALPTRAGRFGVLKKSERESVSESEHLTLFSDSHSKTHT